MKILRKYTSPDSPSPSVSYTEYQGCQVPSTWSVAARAVLTEKYLRKTGVPGIGQETDARQAFRRLSETWARWGRRFGYFDSEEDARHFHEELYFQLEHQIGSPNSPQWFNTGLYEMYGITGPTLGYYYVDSEGKVRECANAYEHPQVHACFIQSLGDDLVSEGGIWDLWMREAKVFKFGSGSGTNFSCLRAEGEPLSGGGTSSGLLSFLRVGDRAAGAIRSGGTTRRAAKMVVVDIDHPEVEAFIEWKVREEQKVRALIAGSQALRAQGETDVPLFDADWRGEAYQTVSGQHSNNSVRVNDAFFSCLQKKKAWELRYRSGGAVCRQIPAVELWRKIAHAAWICADPGLQFESSIQSWHTCPNDGPIRASNPCAEYFFLDDTACNLASLNLLKFMDPMTGAFDIERFRHSVRLWTLVLEISNTMARYPSRTIAETSSRYRTLGLGFANLGALLMAMGISYASEEGRALAAAVAALLTGEAYAVSAELAKELGPFPRFQANREAMLEVIRRHRNEAHSVRLEKAPEPLREAARAAWDRALNGGLAHGFRNAQVSAIAPTGTIGLLMDCDTTGVEPEYAMVKTKVLAGGGQFKLTSRAVALGLRCLGYGEQAAKSIQQAFLQGTPLGDIPMLKAAHQAVFTIASQISPSNHVAMVAAVQPFVSGGISKTVNVAKAVGVEAIERVYHDAWKLGLKAISVYRDGSKLSQPLQCGIGGDCA